MNYSKQREIIKNSIKNRKDHPTAQQLYETIHKTHKTISLATVYRNLNLLADIGQLKRLRVSDNSEHFDPILDEHVHYCCTNCHNIYDIDTKVDLSHIQKIIENDFGDIDKQDLVIHGVCRHCKEQVS